MPCDGQQNAAVWNGTEFPLKLRIQARVYKQGRLLSSDEVRCSKTSAFVLNSGSSIANRWDLGDLKYSD